MENLKKDFGISELDYSAELLVSIPQMDGTFRKKILTKGTPEFEEYKKGCSRIYTSSELKQEAIRWIKELEKTIVYPYGKDIPMLDGTNELTKFSNSRDWIKHFFNIKDEELEG